MLAACAGAALEIDEITLELFIKCLIIRFTIPIGIEVMHLVSGKPIIKLMFLFNKFAIVNHKPPKGPVQIFSPLAQDIFFGIRMGIVNGPAIKHPRVDRGFGYRKILFCYAGH